jgi:integrase
LDKHWTQGVSAVPKTVRDASLETRTARSRLKPAGKPYYRAINEGLHVGYRKGKTSGKWVMRRYTGGTYVVETIATADDTLDADGAEILTFSQAQAIARERFVGERRAASGLPVKTAGPFTVRQCVDEYIEWLEQNRKSSGDARVRANALILPQLGDTECSKLTTKQLKVWRDATAKARARLRTKKGQTQRFREDHDEDPDEVRRKRQASTNRTLTILKAALNAAWRDEKIPSDQAWRAVEPFEGADAARIRWLMVAEAKRLINACAPEFRNLVRTGLTTGCRYSELAALRVEDYQPDNGTIHVRRSKSGKGRHVVLNQEGQELFASLCRGRAGSEPLLVKVGGGRWLKGHQSRPMVEACEHAKIDPPIGFHGLRHTYASLAIMAGAPLMVVAKNLGHADTRMVEKHYGHMTSSYVADAIRAAAPTFDFHEVESLGAEHVGYRRRNQVVALSQGTAVLSSCHDIGTGPTMKRQPEQNPSVSWRHK